jgi:hypothetical protein
MHVFHWVGFVVFVCVALLTADASTDAEKKRSRFFKPKKNDKPAAPKAPPPKLNTDILPTIDEVLESVGLSHVLPIFLKQGISETRFLLRMTPTDFNMMVSCKII